MNPFAVQFEASAARMLLRTHGETVSYYRSDSINPVSRQALIERDQLKLAPILGEGEEGAIVAFLNDETDGILSGDVDTDMDKIELSMQVGQEAQLRQVLKIISSNGGMTRVLV